MTTHRARCCCRRPNTLVNQSRRVSARTACMESFSLTAKNAKARRCASICGIKTDAQFANAPVWPSAQARPLRVFSETLNSFYLMLNTYWCRRCGLEGSGAPALHLSVHFCRGQWQVATSLQGGADIKAADGTACSQWQVATSPQGGADIEAADGTACSGSTSQNNTRVEVIIKNV